MKKTLFLLLIFALSITACKKDENDDENTQSTGQPHLNPPAWIQGTWTDPNSPEYKIGYQFTSDDMLSILGDNSVSLKSTLTSADNISENSVSGSYQFTVKYSATNSSESWQFNSIDDTHIESVHGTVIITLTKE